MIINYLHPSELLALHHQLTETAAITEPTLRDSLLVELACARAQLTPQPTQNPQQILFTATALLAESIILWRPFTVLNNATAFAAIQAMLALNNYRLACSPAIAKNTAKNWNESTEYPAIAKWLSLAAEEL
ncbi:MAG: hypothetical protein EBR79_03495 [Proteobacteria bacterium]|nr:hypothetical protein [Pseudomonadota bacterium]NBX86634.1 hypothetical protein [Pseudomonadota bacterium]